MNVRNCKYNASGTIDCEIEHPTYGWIPFTANPDDPEKHGRDIYEAAMNGDYGEIEPYDPPPPEPPQYPKFTALEMLDLFTDDEQLAVVGATMNNPAVKLWYDRLIAATYVTYDDPRTEAGLQALVDAELLTPERKGQIVDAMQPVQPQPS